MTTPLPRLDGHRLRAPTADDFRAALRRRLPGEQADAVWARVCDLAGAPPTSEVLAVAQMEALAAALTALGGAAGLVGRDMAVRVASYRLLAATPADQPAAGARDWGRLALERLLVGRTDQPDRFRELEDLDLFSEDLRAVLDRSAREVAEGFGTSIGLVSIVLDGSQVFAGSHGLLGWVEATGGTPVEWSFCATMVRTREPYLVPDADVAQRTNPLVQRDGIRSYAGVPLITSRGHVLGSCCVIDDAPRSYTGEEVARLQAVADRLVEELERRRVSARRRDDPTAAQQQVTAHPGDLGCSGEPGDPGACAASGDPGGPRGCDGSA